MQLSYRGVTYEYNSTSVETIQGEVGGKYRSLPWRHLKEEAVCYVKDNM